MNCHKNIKGSKYHGTITFYCEKASIEALHAVCITVIKPGMRMGAINSPNNIKHLVYLKVRRFAAKKLLQEIQDHSFLQIKTTSGAVNVMGKTCKEFMHYSLSLSNYGHFGFVVGLLVYHTLIGMVATADTVLDNIESMHVRCFVLGGTGLVLQ